MNESKHTPGPWTHSNLVVRADRSQKHPMGRQIADCYRELPAGHFDEGENAANARLIAAAPDLLEALVGLAQVIEAHVPPGAPAYAGPKFELVGCWHKYAAETIAKAQGAPA